jgi:GLPGLI family protein
MMKTKYLIVAIPLVFLTKVNSQQTNILLSGKIEFEKKINLYSQFNDDDSWTAEFKKRIPQFKTSYFDLSFTETKTFYQPGRDNADNNKLWEQPSEDNIVYTDLEKKAAISQKKVFEKTFLVQDSARTIHWKMTDEKRTIAGYECRRANALIMDSIYIVAFYTDDIASTGGPESFNGLPGMILGLAIPHEHVTWFATKLYTATTVKETDFKIPVKGSKTTNAGLQQNLRSNLKNWGKYGERYIKAAML